MAVIGVDVLPRVRGPICEQATIFCGEPSSRKLQKLLLCAVDMVLDTGSLAALVKTVVQLISALPRCVRSLCAEQARHWHTGAHHEDFRSACAVLAQIVTHVSFAFEVCKDTYLDAARDGSAGAGAGAGTAAAVPADTNWCTPCLRRQTSSEPEPPPVPVPMSMSTAADAEIHVLERELWQDALAQWRLTLMLSLDSFLPCCHRALALRSERESALAAGDVGSRHQDVEHIFTMLSTLWNPSPSLYGESEIYWIWRAAALHGATLMQLCVNTLARLTELEDSGDDVGPPPVLAMACVHGLLLSPYWSRSHEVHLAMSGAVRIESMADALAACICIVEEESTLLVALQCIAAANRVWFHDLTPETKACAASLKTALHSIALHFSGSALSDAARLLIHQELIRLI
jgi:hypothetical protein